MSFRKEEKIIINNEKLFDLKNWLNKNNAIEIHNPRIVNSIYFDNKDFSMYHDSNEGTLPRKKIRLRCYNENFNFDGAVKKEIKISSFEGRFKESSSDKNSNKIFKLGVFDNIYGICDPILNVTYTRRYFLIKNIRITLDEKIFYKKISNKIISSFREIENLNVLELKSDMNTDANKLIMNFPFERQRFSKYCKGIEKVYRI